MKRTLVSIALVLATLAVSCKEEEQNAKMQEVMAVHNEVMPKMSRLGQLVGTLKGMENDSTETGKRYKSARIDLQEANEAMMGWMQNFGKRFTPDEILNGAELSESKREWLDEEEEKVKALKEQIDSSIAEAEALLDDREK